MGNTKICTSSSQSSWCTPFLPETLLRGVIANDRRWLLAITKKFWILLVYKNLSLFINLLILDRIFGKKVKYNGDQLGQTKNLVVSHFSLSKFCYTNFWAIASVFFNIVRKWKFWISWKSTNLKPCQWQSGETTLHGEEMGITLVAQRVNCVPLPCAAICWVQCCQTIPWEQVAFLYDTFRHQRPISIPNWENFILCLYHAGVGFIGSNP